MRVVISAAVAGGSPKLLRFVLNWLSSNWMSGGLCDAYHLRGSAAPFRFAAWLPDQNLHSATVSTHRVEARSVK
jgi:hypothetical protein